MVKFMRSRTRRRTVPLERLSNPALLYLAATHPPSQRRPPFERDPPAQRLPSSQRLPPSQRRPPSPRLPSQRGFRPLGGTRPPSRPLLSGLSLSQRRPPFQWRFAPPSGVRPLCGRCRLGGLRPLSGFCPIGGLRLQGLCPLCGIHPLGGLSLSTVSALSAVLALSPCAGIKRGRTNEGMPSMRRRPHKPEPLPTGQEGTTAVIHTSFPVSTKKTDYRACRPRVSTFASRNLCPPQGHTPTRRPWYTLRRHELCIKGATLIHTSTHELCMVDLTDDYRGHLEWCRGCVPTSPWRPRPNSHYLASALTGEPIDSDLCPPTPRPGNITGSYFWSDGPWAGGAGWGTEGASRGKTAA